MIEAELAQEEPAMSVILKTLERIKAIFEDTAGLVTKYGLEQELKDMELDEPLALSPPERKQKWTAGFSSIVRTASTVIERCRWAIVDREKSESLVKDVKDFNDGLYNITLPAKERRSLGMAVLCAMGTDTQDAARLQDIESASVTHSSNTIAEP